MQIENVRSSQSEKDETANTYVIELPLYRRFTNFSYAATALMR